MIKHDYGKLLFPTLFVFASVTVIFMAAPRFWDNLGISHRVVVVGNALLYALSALTTWMHLKAIKSPSPYVFTNSVMGSTVLKLVVLGIATAIYLVIVGKDKSVLAIFTTMFLYIIYTILDVKTALLLNKKQ